MAPGVCVSDQLIEGKGGESPELGCLLAAAQTFGGEERHDAQGAASPSRQALNDLAVGPGWKSLRRAGQVPSGDLNSQEFGFAKAEDAVGQK